LHGRSPAAIRYNRSMPACGAHKGATADGRAHPMTARDTLLCIIPVMAVLILALFIRGIIVQIEEWERRAQGTKIFQPDHNLWKLLHKQVLAPLTALRLFGRRRSLPSRACRRADLKPSTHRLSATPVSHRDSLGGGLVLTIASGFVESRTGQICPDLLATRRRGRNKRR